MSSAYPRMAASGVLSSWLMLATNWFLCWLAISRSSTVLASSRVRAWTSSKRRVFSIAITAWSAKGVDEFDLPFGERAHFGAPNGDRPDCLACVDQGDAKHGTPAASFKRKPARFGVFIRFCQDVGDVNRSPVDDATPCNEPTHKRSRELSDRAGRGILPVVSDEAQTIAKHLKDRGVIRIAQACCGLDQRIEYFLHVERRPADDLQNIGGGRLLFQGFLQLALARLLCLEQPCVLDGDDGLVGEGLDQLDLLISEWSYLLTVDG